MTNANGNSGSAGGGEGLFKKPAPEGAAKKMSEVLGEVVWLMSQSPCTRLVSHPGPGMARRAGDKEKELMTPVLLGQFRLYYADGPAGGGQGGRPIGVVLWASVSDEVEETLSRGTTKLRPQDWKSGDKLWVVEVIAPFGGAEEMVKDLKAKVFPGREVRFVALGPDSKAAVRSV